MLRPYRAEAMRAYPASPLVNSPKCVSGRSKRQMDRSLRRIDDAFRFFLRSQSPPASGHRADVFAFLAHRNGAFQYGKVVTLTASGARGVPKQGWHNGSSKEAFPRRQIGPTAWAE